MQLPKLGFLKVFSLLGSPELILFVGLTIQLTGCAQDANGDRLPVSGSVTVAGKPLDVNSTIFFEPVDGNAGVGSSGSVVNGDFTIPAEGGPTPGQTYKVRVVTAPGIPKDGTPPDKIKLSKRYEKTVEIPSKDGGTAPELTIDFD